MLLAKPSLSPPTKSPSRFAFCRLFARHPSYAYCTFISFSFLFRLESRASFGFSRCFAYLVYVRSNVRLQDLFRSGRRSRNERDVVDFAYLGSKVFSLFGFAMELGLFFFI